MVEVFAFGGRFFREDFDFGIIFYFAQSLLEIPQGSRKGAKTQSKRSIIKYI
jgi:hypothetical protein